jgi:CheY-like chemotaxis protein
MGKAILYIEDNYDNANIVGEILRREGYTVIIAEDGRAGIALAEEHQPDLIISDFHLPDMKGPEIVTAIREKKTLENTLIIMLTADIYSYADSMAVGVNAYLNKPIRLNQLLSTVKKLL